jgi:hypothetical protein
LGAILTPHSSLPVQVQLVASRLFPRFLPCTAKIPPMILVNPVSQWVLNHLKEASGRPTLGEQVPTQAHNNKHGHPRPSNLYRDLRPLSACVSCSRWIWARPWHSLRISYPNPWTWFGLSLTRLPASMISTPISPVQSMPPTSPSAVSTGTCFEEPRSISYHWSLSLLSCSRPTSPVKSIKSYQSSEGMQNILN